MLATVSILGTSTRVRLVRPLYTSVESWSNVVASKKATSMGLESIPERLFARRRDRGNHLVQALTKVALELNKDFLSLKASATMTISNTHSLRALTAILIAGSVAASGCASMNKKQEGAVSKADLDKDAAAQSEAEGRPARRQASCSAPTMPVGPS